MSNGKRIHGKGNGKVLRKTREKLNNRRNAYARLSSAEKDSQKAPGSMKYKQ